MSSPCLSGGGRTYGFELQIVKSPSTSTRSSQTSSSPSSTLSESSNSPLAISTRKTRSPRKRPNQTYNEAAAILSTAYPRIFSDNINDRKFTKPRDLLVDESSELLLPFRLLDNSDFLLHQPINEKRSLVYEPKLLNLTKFDQTSWHNNSMELYEGDDLDAESILDEEVEEGIDSIMGNLSVSNEDLDGHEQMNNCSSWYGCPMGFNLGHGIGMSKGIKAMRHVEESNWWNFPIVDMHQISPRINNRASNPISNSNHNPKPKLKSKEKKKTKVEKPIAGLKDLEMVIQNERGLNSSASSGLLLKLNYDEVLSAWSDRGSPFSVEIEGNDVSARLAQIDLFTESGGVREASVQRYKEKRRARLFSKKIRYQVRKLNADQRPRMKGRFVRRPNSSTKVKNDDN